MRAFLYLLGVLLVLPGTLFGAAVVLAGEAIAAHSIFGILGVLLQRSYQFLTWGMWVLLVVAVAWIAAGFAPRFRFAGTIVTIAFGAFALVQLFVASRQSGQSAALIPVLTVLGMAAAGWLAYAEWPVSAST